jgi:ribokinase
VAFPELNVVVVGGVNTDYTVSGPRLPGPGDTVQGSDFHEAPGGKGANQAVAAARLGARVALVARVGTDRRGRAAVARLREEGVDTGAVLGESEAPTGVALVMVDQASEKQILTAPGANLSLTEADIVSHGELFAHAKIVLIDLEVPLAAAAAAARLARAAGARVVLDPAPAIPLPEDMLRDVHVIRPNAGEAEILTGITVCDRQTAAEAARNLLLRGVGAACVGAPKGNLLVSSEGELWLEHLPVRAVDKTGAGDALAGALAAALADGMFLEDAARFAHTAAALKTKRLGAQAGLPHRSEVLAAMGRRDPRQGAAR